MKKVFLTLLISFTIFFGLTNNVSADCRDRGLLSCNAGETTCSVGDFFSKSYCCASQSECDALQPASGCSDRTTMGGCALLGGQRVQCQPINGRTYCCGSQSECGTIESGQQSTTATTPSTGCPDSTYINTAIGCIPVLGNGSGFAGFLLKWAVGVGSGIAFILILYAGFMIMTSQGNPDRLKAGQELLTSAISGLILIVISVFILKFIGIDILGLGRFGFGQ